MSFGYFVYFPLIFADEFYKALVFLYKYYIMLGRFEEKFRQVVRIDSCSTGAPGICRWDMPLQVKTRVDAIQSSPAAPSGYLR